MFSTENDFLKTRHSCTHAEMRKARAHCHATVQSKHILLNSQCGNFHSNSPLTSTNVTCLIYRVAQKNFANLCTPYNFIKYWPIFKLFSLSELGEKLQ